MKNENRSSETKLPFFGIGRIAPFLRPYIPRLIVMITLGIAGSAIDIILPLFQQYAIDSYILSGDHGTLPYFVLLYLLTLVSQVAVNCTTTYTASRVELLVGRDLKDACFDKLQTLSFSYFNQNSVGYLHARVMSDTARIGELVSWYMMDGIWNVTYIVGALAVMFSLEWIPALAVLAVLPIAALLITLCQRRLVTMNRHLRELNGKITGNYNEGITGARTVKTLCIEEKILSDFRKDSEKMRRVSVRTMHLRALLTSSVSFFAFAALAIVLRYGGMLTLEGQMRLGTLQVFMSYALGMVEPLQWTIDAISALFSTRVNIERVTRLMETDSDVLDSPEVIRKYGDTFSPRRENWEPLEGEVAFDDVTFRYPDGKETVLEHFSLHVPKGSTVAIVGETGAGKSTLVNLVCRFYEPTEGRVLIDGRDARERSQLWLHSSIGYVLQTPQLFSGSVRENLLYGRPDATDEEMMAALKIVHADEIVAKMDKGLDSEVGEGGDLLSTGEKQLLSFARAILANPRILVLDEATSSIDSVTEQIIQGAIGEITRGRTSFVIAHRLSTIRDADVIIAVIVYLSAFALLIKLWLGKRGKAANKGKEAQN